MNKIKYTAILITILITGCELKFDDYKPSSGEADFTTFVALGDSYTAGYTDGALGAKGQLSSIPNIIAGQLNLVGNKGFKQPMVTSNGSVGSGGTGYYTLEIVNGNLTPVPGAGDMTILAERVYDKGSPIQNLGVPGAKSSHLLATAVNAEPLVYYADANPFFGRFASSRNTSVIADAIAQKPSFVYLWIGGNDVLTYAIAGGESDSVTKPQLFEFYLNTIATSLFTGATKGAIANVPNIEDLPYFNFIMFNENQPLFIQDEEALGGVRQLVEGEKVLLSAAPLFPLGYGAPDKALEAKYVLDLKELKEIREAIVEYNNTIKSISDQYGLAHVDLYGAFKELSTKGRAIDGNLYTAAFVSGGIFSLDGIHATERGYAILANEFIDAINSKYSSKIPQVNVNDYPTVVYP